MDEQMKYFLERESLPLVKMDHVKNSKKVLECYVKLDEAAEGFKVTDCYVVVSTVGKFCQRASRASEKSFMKEESTAVVNIITV